jgi:hypothetical protein
MRRTLPAFAGALICTVVTAAAVFAQGIGVRLDGRTGSVVLAALERRTIVTEDRGLRTEFESVALRAVLINARGPRA